MRVLFALVVVAGIVAVGGEAQAQQRDFFNRGVGLFDPVIDVVESGSRLVVGPTVSADRKYVTISGRFQNTQLQGIENFRFFGVNDVGGNVGGAVPAPALGEGQAAGVGRDNGSAPPAIRPMPRQGVLNQAGMTRLAFD